MVGYAGSPTYTVYVDVTLTQSRVKVTGLLNFRQLAKLYMLVVMTAAPLFFLVCCQYQCNSLPEKAVPEMTYYVSTGTLSTCSLTIH